MTLLGLIPGLSSLVQNVTTAWFNTKVQLASARLGVDRDVAVAMLKAAAQEEMTNAHKLSIIASNPLLTFLLVAFALPYAFFEWKGVFIDKVIGPGCIWYTHICWIGETDPLKGVLADWSTTIMTFLFGAPTAMGIGKMWFGRNKTGE
jgi:hypothetical protein